MVGSAEREAEREGGAPLNVTGDWTLELWSYGLLEDSDGSLGYLLGGNSQSGFRLHRGGAAGSMVASRAMNLSMSTAREASSSLAAARTRENEIASDHSRSLSAPRLAAAAQ